MDVEFVVDAADVVAGGVDADVELTRSALIAIACVSSRSRRSSCGVS
jgi:hypothetical protein